MTPRSALAGSLKLLAINVVGSRAGNPDARYRDSISVFYNQLSVDRIVQYGAFVVNTTCSFYFQWKMSHFILSRHLIYTLSGSTSARFHVITAASLASGLLIEKCY